jgi:hypothetical protein
LKKKKMMMLLWFLEVEVALDDDAGKKLRALQKRARNLVQNMCRNLHN